MVVGESQADLTQSDHHELSSLAAHPAQGRDSPCVERVEVLVDLVEIVERTRFVVLYGEDEGECGHRLLAARKHAPLGVLALAGRDAVHLQASLEGFLRVLHPEAAAPRRLQDLVDPAEVFVHVLEDRHQASSALVLQLLRYGYQLAASVTEQISVLDEAGDSLDGGVVVLDGEHVDIAEMTEAALEPLHALLRLGHSRQLHIRRWDGDLNGL